MDKQRARRPGKPNLWVVIVLKDPSFGKNFQVVQKHLEERYKTARSELRQGFQATDELHLTLMGICTHNNYRTEQVSRILGTYAQKLQAEGRDLSFQLTLSGLGAFKTKSDNIILFADLEKACCRHVKMLAKDIRDYLKQKIDEEELQNPLTEQQQQEIEAQEAKDKIEEGTKGSSGSDSSVVSSEEASSSSSEEESSEEQEGISFLDDTNYKGLWFDDPREDLFIPHVTILNSDPKNDRKLRQMMIEKKSNPTGGRKGDKRNKRGGMVTKGCRDKGFSEPEEVKKKVVQEKKDPFGFDYNLLRDTRNEFSKFCLGTQLVDNVELQQFYKLHMVPQLTVIGVCKKMKACFSRTPLEVLKDLQDNSFNDIVRLHYSDTQQEIQFAQRAVQETFVAEDVTYNGLSGLGKALDRATLDELAKHLGLEAVKLRVQLEKNVVNKLDDIAVDVWTKALTDDLATSITDALKLDDKGEIAAWVYTKGLTTFFRQFAAEELTQWCQDSGLATTSHSKEILIEALITQTDAEIKNTTGNRTHIHSGFKTKPELKKGITVGDILHWFNLSEVKAFLQTHGVAQTGRSTEIAKRAVQVLEGTYVATKPTKKRGARAESLDGVAKTKKRAAAAPKTPKAESASAPTTPRKKVKRATDEEGPETKKRKVEPRVTRSKSTAEDVTHELPQKKKHKKAATKVDAPVETQTTNDTKTEEPKAEEPAPAPTRTTDGEGEKQMDIEPEVKEKTEEPVEERMEEDKN